MTKLHPAIETLRAEMVRRKTTPYGLEPLSGVAGETITNWVKGRHEPRVSLLEAVLNVVGYTLVAMPVEKKPDYSDPNVYDLGGARDSNYR